MKLTPYPDVRMRWYKVCKHVFNKDERWFDVFRDIERWHADWKVLNAAGAVKDPTVDLQGRAVEVADRNHASWLGAAEAACEEAIRSQRVWPDGDRVSYIGDAGVHVVVAPGSALVTCFRPGGGRSRVTDEERVEKGVAKASQGWTPRAAVRRGQRRSSLNASLARTPGSERDDA